MNSPRPVAISAIHPKHLSLGAAMMESDGWQRPARYTTVEEEYGRLRDAVGICDISPTGKLVLHGDIDGHLAGVLWQAGPSDVGSVGVVQPAADSEIEEMVMARLAGDEALLLTAPNQAPLVTGLLDVNDERCAHSVDVTSVLAGVKIAGPLAQRLLAGVTEMDTSPAAFPDMSCAQGSASLVHATLLRHDQGGLPGYELYFGREYGEYMWDTLMEAGEPHGVVPFGIETLARLG